jgi:hypothetical protein
VQYFQTKMFPSEVEVRKYLKSAKTITSRIFSPKSVRSLYMQTSLLFQDRVLIAINCSLWLELVLFHEKINPFFVSTLSPLHQESARSSGV